jgi:hypothetical protein
VRLGAALHALLSIVVAGLATVTTSASHLLRAPTAEARTRSVSGECYRATPGRNVSLGLARNLARQVPGGPSRVYVARSPVTRRRYRFRLVSARRTRSGQRGSLLRFEAPGARNQRLRVDVTVYC